MTPTTFNVVIVTPDTTLFEGSVRRIIAPGSIQDLAVLPDHTPLYARLKEGNITLTTDSGTIEKIPITGGIIRVRRNKASIIVGF